MIGTSVGFQREVRQSHVAASKVEIIQNGQVVLTLAVHGGSVDADRTAAQLRRFTAQVADPDGSLTPEGLRDKLAPFGTLARVYRGVRVPAISETEEIFVTATDWATGTFDHTVATGGVLQLG